jgi:hypothetical protein
MHFYLKRYGNIHWDSPPRTQHAGGVSPVIFL